MKRGCLTTLLVLALCVGALVAGYRYKYRDYSYRYRLTVNIEVDGKVHSGSSVIEVKWRGGPVVGDGGPFGPSVKGQAALVDLGDRGVVVATLLNGEDYGPAKDGALGALWIAPRAFGTDTNAETIPHLPELQGKRDVGLVICHVSCGFRILRIQPPPRNCLCKISRQFSAPRRASPARQSRSRTIRS